jgi:branched-chain amino acid transport system ATP-binding protein
MRILEAKRLSMRFGGLLAVDQLDLEIDEGQILGLIGPNGAGKTTAFNCIAGVYQATAGEITFSGERTNGQRPWDLCRKGLARTFQVVKPFATKTVLYNVTVGGFARTTIRARAEEKAREVLTDLQLADKKDVLAGNLTIAERKRLEIARALATEPRLLLLDEVMAGLRPTEVDEMVRIIKRLRDRGITIFLIEHIMRAVMNLSDRIVVLQYGKKIAEGTPREIASDEKVIKAYLGEEYGAA